jgi:chromosome segregation ATPase
VTVTAVRARLGSGSYTTIGAVLNDWRREQARAAQPLIPPIPAGLGHLLRHLWAEAWKSADGLYEPERQAVARERQEHERARQELAGEVRRLEDELERVGAAGESCREALAQQHQELETARVELAKATGTVGLLQAEGERLRAEGQKAIENLTTWIERATKAETKLEETERAKARDAGE